MVRAFVELDALVADEFILEAAPEGLDKSIIVVAAWANHGNEEIVLS